MMSRVTRRMAVWLLSTESLGLDSTRTSPNCSRSLRVTLKLPPLEMKPMKNGDALKPGVAEVASWYRALGCGATGAGGMGGCGAAPGAAAGAAAAAGTAAVAAASAAALGAGMILSVSRRISFTFCTIESQRLFCAVTSMVEVAPVALGVPACAVPNCVEAVDCIFTLREALR